MRTFTHVNRRKSLLELIPGMMLTSISHSHNKYILMSAPYLYSSGVKTDIAGVHGKSMIDVMVDLKSLPDSKVFAEYVYDVDGKSFWEEIADIEDERRR